MYTVFISVSSELKDLRDSLSKTLRAAGIHVLVQGESLGPAPKDVRDLLARSIDQSDVVLHIAGDHYGADASFPFPEAPEFECSWTQFEYYYAHKKEKHVYAFVMAPGKVPEVEREGWSAEDLVRRKSLQIAHRMRVTTGRFENTPLAGLTRTCNERNEVRDELELLQHLIAFVRQTQHDWGETKSALVDKLEGLSNQFRSIQISVRNIESGTEEIKWRVDRISLALERGAPAAKIKIESTPRLGIKAIPPYSGSHEFIGRQAELAELNDWVTSEQRAVYFLQAIGGSGKSILAWNWLRRSINQGGHWKGRFWYSFYQRGARMHDFLRKALAYVSDEEIEGEYSTSDLAYRLFECLSADPWILVMDGLERLLVDYNRHDAAVRADDDAGEQSRQGSRYGLDLVCDEDEDVLRLLVSASPSKILMTSRLFPNCLKNSAGMAIPGVTYRSLSGLNPDDAYSLMQSCDVFGERSSMQEFLKRNCDYHPLVVGVIAGLVRNFLPAPGDFELWRVSIADGLALDLTSSQLKNRKTHILEFALSQVSDSARDLLARLAMFLNECEYNVLLRLKGSDARLRNDILELERRGFLLMNRRDGVYDLHPVVRSVVLKKLGHEERELVGASIEDYFSAAPEKSMREASSLEDLRIPVSRVKNFLLRSRWDEAYEILKLGLFNALWLNLERYDVLVELVGGFFDGNWETVRGADTFSRRSQIYNLANILLQEFGLYREACSCALAHLRACWEVGELSQTCVANLAWALYEAGYLNLAHEFFRCALDLANAECDDAGVFNSHLLLCRICAVVGRLDEADQHWSVAQGMGADWGEHQYRQGGLEVLRLRIALQRGTASVEDFSAAEVAIGSSLAARKHRRELLRMRGRWFLERGDFQSAIWALSAAASLAKQAQNRDSEAEALLALGKFRAGLVGDCKDAAEWQSRLSPRDDLSLALLWEALGNSERALQHAVSAKTHAVADGEPWVIRDVLNSVNALAARLGKELPIMNGRVDGNHWPGGFRSEWTPGLLLQQLNTHIEARKKVNAERILRWKEIDVANRGVSRRGHQIHKLKAKDTTGQWAYYFVLVDESRERDFLKAIKGSGVVDLESFGQIIASNYGEAPSAEVLDFLYKSYGFKMQPVDRGESGYALRVALDAQIRRWHAEECEETKRSLAGEICGVFGKLLAIGAYLSVQDRQMMKRLGCEAGEDCTIR